MQAVGQAQAFGGHPGSAALVFPLGGSVAQNQEKNFMRIMWRENNPNRNPNALYYVSTLLGPRGGNHLLFSNFYLAPRDTRPPWSHPTNLVIIT
jgi:hypothetical protein